MTKSSQVQKPENTNHHPAAAVGPAADFSTHDLDSLSKDLGAPDETFAKRMFATASEAKLVDDGTSVDSINVLSAVPAFVASARAIAARLQEPQKKLVRLPAEIYPLIVREATVLRAMKADHDAGGNRHAAGKAERDEALRLAFSAGIAERDSVYDAIKSALGDGPVAELNIVTGRADDAEALAKGCEGLADLIERKAKGSAEAAASMKDFEVTADTAKELRQRAAALRELGKSIGTPGRRVSQRMLDVQDGRVLFLMEKVLRAFRAARRADSTILLPELGKLAKKFATRPKGKGGRTKEPGAGDGAPSGAAAKTSSAANGSGASASVPQ
jgi:uncharacterized protein YecT (DUF1311 family)